MKATGNSKFEDFLDYIHLHYVEKCTPFIDTFSLSCIILLIVCLACPYGSFFVYKMIVELEDLANALMFSV